MVFFGSVATGGGCSRAFSVTAGGGCVRGLRRWLGCHHLISGGGARLLHFRGVWLAFIFLGGGAGSLQFNSEGVWLAFICVYSFAALLLCCSGGVSLEELSCLQIREGWGVRSGMLVGMA